MLGEERKELDEQSKGREEIRPFHFILYAG